MIDAASLDEQDVVYQYAIIYWVPLLSVLSILKSRESDSSTTLYASNLQSPPVPKIRPVSIQDEKSIWNQFRKAENQELNNARCSVGDLNLFVMQKGLGTIFLWIVIVL